MLGHNDMWFMNESLAFYMSINTFSNPMFDAQVEETRLGETSRMMEGGSRQTVVTSNRERWTDFCDSLKFSLRSKMYVLELNFKRKLRHLRRFAGENLGLFSNNYRCKQGTRTNKSCNEEKSEDKFWKNIEFNSRDNFGAQQEKILCRLEQAVKTKRSNQQLFNIHSLELVNSFRAGQPVNLDNNNLPINGKASNSMRARPSSIISTTSQKVQNESAIRTIKRQSRWHAGVVNPKHTISRQCIVCYTNQPNIVTFPCKHHDICSDCFIEMIYISVKQSQYPLKCVLCRQKIEKIVYSENLSENVT